VVAYCILDNWFGRDRSWNFDCLHCQGYVWALAVSCKCRWCRSNIFWSQFNERLVPRL